MSLELKINEDIKQAMRDKNKLRLEALRAIKSEVLLAKTSKSGDSFSEEDEIKLLQKMVKQRKDSAQIYKDQGREDLADPELAQVEIIQDFLPAQMSEAELEEAVKAIIAQTGASSMADMGKVMGIASKQLAGKSDGKSISAMVKKLLG